MGERQGVGIMFGRREFIRFFLIGGLLSGLIRKLMPTGRKRDRLRRARFWKRV